MSNTNSSNQDDAFEKFQLEEYKNISTSHYEAVKQVSTFFRYYLLLLSAPALLLTLIGKSNEQLADFFQGKLNVGVYDLIFFYFIFIALSGFCMFIYIINIRHDSILYARTVNKVRKYFYERSSITIKEYPKYVGLPLTDSKPTYLDSTIFFPLVILFISINTGFLVFAFHLRKLCSEFIFDFSLIVDFSISESEYIISIIFLFLHLALWRYLSYSRENKYLKSYAFGVDIDGVMNNQTELFVKWLEKLKIKIKEQNILEIPVRLNPDLGVNAFHEEVIFNSKEYWEELSESENVFKTIKDIKNVFGYKVFIYTHRDWGNMSEDVKSKIKDLGFTPITKKDILKITTNWFEKQGIKVFIVNNWRKAFLNFLILPIFRTKIRLMFEKGNTYISDNRFLFIVRKQTLLLNRFQSSKKNQIKFFVEDRPDNAIKLSNIVEYVFLFDQPYNQDVSKYSFPKNVIRVGSWNMIYSYLKELS